MVGPLQRRQRKVSTLIRAVKNKHQRGIAYASVIYLAGNSSLWRITVEGYPESRNGKGINGLLLSN
jgi:hypothetical protein